MQAPTRPATPTHEKLRAVREETQAIGEFLDWLQNSEKVALMVWRRSSYEAPCPWRADDDEGYEFKSSDRLCVGGYDPSGDACRRCKGRGYVGYDRSGWVLDGRKIETLLGAYFDIDPDELEREKKAILDYLRDLGDQEAHAEPGPGAGGSLA